MSSRLANWAGAGLTATVVIGLAVCFTVVGLDRADKLASVLGIFLGLAGIALSFYGQFTNRQGWAGSFPDRRTAGDEESGPTPSLPAPARDAEVWPEFDVVLRGYDPHIIDEFIALMRSNPSLAPTAPPVPIVWRGYDRHQVDRYLRQKGWPALSIWASGWSWSH
jgi:hypothetical protein